MKPVGIFDSGVGGISVLREAISHLPNENFIYFGDTKNAPYGTKSEQEVQNFALDIADRLIAKDAKAIVIACNTATSVAASALRSRYQIPIIGMEPALKPAAMLRHGGKILVLATPLTLKLPKFQALMATYGAGTVPIACEGLMEFVENGVVSGPALMRHIEGLIGPHLNGTVDAVVLGCTHYVFLREALTSFFHEGTTIVDGNLGTVMQLKRKLHGIGSLNDRNIKGQVSLSTSGDPSRVLPLMENLLCLNTKSMI